MVFRGLRKAPAKIYQKKDKVLLIFRLSQQFKSIYDCCAGLTEGAPHFWQFTMAFDRFFYASTFCFMEERFFTICEDSAYARPG